MPNSYLIAALSGRALAAAARRAGFAPLVADLFGDRDTRQIAAATQPLAGTLNGGLEAGPLWDALEALSEERSEPPKGLVWGAGFEDRPALLAALARRFPLCGNGPTQVRAVKDPKVFFALLTDLGIPHPTVRISPLGMPQGWLVKRSGASGGSHIQRARRRDVTAADRYFQRRLPGTALSAQFLADGQRALLLGWARQFTAPSRHAPFRFGGLAGPVMPEPALIAPAANWLNRLVAATGLVGLNSADFIATRDGLRLLEINPRPGAALDVFDSVAAQPLLALHGRACAGELPDEWAPNPGARAAAIVYARRGLRVPKAFNWPSWTADQGPAGTTIARGTPVCTVLTRAATSERAWEMARTRAETIQGTLAAANPPNRANKRQNALQEIRPHG